MDCRDFIPPNRLAELLRRPGGPTVSEAIAATQANLQGLRRECAEDLQRRLTCAEALAGRLGTAPDDHLIAGLYDLAVQAIGLGEICGLGDLDHLLSGMCDALDAQAMDRRADPAAIRAHIAAWRELTDRDGRI